MVALYHIFLYPALIENYDHEEKMERLVEEEIEKDIYT